MKSKQCLEILGKNPFLSAKVEASLILFTFEHISDIGKSNCLFSNRKPEARITWDKEGQQLSCFSHFQRVPLVIEALKLEYKAIQAGAELCQAQFKLWLPQVKLC